MDPEKHKEDIDCESEGIEEDEAYQHLNPEGLKDLDFPTDANWHRKLEILDIYILEENRRKLDKWQRAIVDIGLKYTKDLQKFLKGSNSLQRPRNLVVIIHHTF